MFEGGDTELLERIAVGLTIVNDTIKLAVVYEGIRAHMLFWRREMILSEPMSPEAAAVAYEEARAATAEAEEAERARRREGGDGGPEADEAERGTSAGVGGGPPSNGVASSSKSNGGGGGGSGADRAAALAGRAAAAAGRASERRAFVSASLGERGKRTLV